MKNSKSNSKKVTSSKSSLKKVDGMSLTTDMYKEYKSITDKGEKAAWKDRYTEKSLPPFSHIYRNGKLVPVNGVVKSSKSAKRKSK